MTQRLWQRWAEEKPEPEALVFTSEQGLRIDQSNLMSRVLKPAAVDFGIGDWPGFHTLRHTSATRLSRDGWNAMQVQRLGHHKPSFTLDVYVHVLKSDEPEPLGWATRGQYEHHAGEQVG